MPGALIALGVAYLAALGTSESDRRDLALLRACGACPTRPAVRGGAESLLIGLIAGLAGVAVGLAAVQLLVKPAGFSSPIWRGVAVALAAVGLSHRRFRGGAPGEHPPGADHEVSGEGRTAVAGEPGARRWYCLDLVALALSGLIYWLTIRTGFSAVISPDSNPTLSLSSTCSSARRCSGSGATLLLVAPARPVHEHIGSPGRAEAGEPWFPRPGQPWPGVPRRSTGGWW